MLRITRIATGTSVLLKLEGKLLAPWTSALIAEISAANGLELHLDLNQVSFVDDAGLRLLQELIRMGIVIDRSSSFVSELLLGEKP